jgi:hypothetical protein
MRMKIRDDINEIRVVLKQNSLAFEFNNKLILVDEP